MALNETKLLIFSCSMELSIHKIHYILSKIPLMGVKAEYEMWSGSGDCLPYVYLEAYVVSVLFSLNFSFLQCFLLLFLEFILFLISVHFIKVSLFCIIRNFIRRR